MKTRRLFVGAAWLSALLSFGLATTSIGCSEGEETEADENDDSRRRDGGGGGTGDDSSLPPPVTPGQDSSTPPTTSDGGIQGPSFDIDKVLAIQGTFTVTGPASMGIPTAATVTFSFTIDMIGDPTQIYTTARWNLQAQNVVGGTPSDFPPDTNIELALNRESTGSDPRTGMWSFFGLEFDPYAYVLVKVSEGRITEFFYYRRQLEDEETNASDTPYNVSYTITPKP